MIRWKLVLMILTIFGVSTVLAVQQQETPPQSEQAVEEPVAAAGAPRVIGQPRSQQEFEAWQGVEQAAGLSQKAELAGQFLENYPDSGLTPFAHHILARNFYQQNNMELFVEHAELTLQELPGSTDMLAQLAFVYAESGQSAKAMARAQSALAQLQSLRMPPGVETMQWVREKDQLLSDVYYSIGRSYLNYFTQANQDTGPQQRAADANLQKAIDHFQKATELDPRHEYAYFRLGFAYTNKNDVDNALQAYARAAATGGVASQPSLDKMKQIHQFVQENLPDSAMAEATPDGLIQKQKEKLQQDLAQREREIASEAAKIEAEQPPQEVPPETEPQPEPVPPRV